MAASGHTSVVGRGGRGTTVASWYLLCQIEVLKNEARANAPVTKSVVLNLDSDESKTVSEWLESC